MGKQGKNVAWGEAVDVVLRGLRGWKGLVQREEQARQVKGVLLQRLAETTRIGATGGASPLPYEKRE